MGRYLGPKERLSRRAGVDLGLKGERTLVGKGALERRGDVAPGQHGRRMRRPNTYGQQLLEKQKARWSYGLREHQFRRYAHTAIRKRDMNSVAGDRLFVLLESRLDNVIYRLGFAATRAQARQFVSHGHVLVNGHRLDIPSAQISIQDRITLDDTPAVRERALAAFADVTRVPSWLEADGDQLAGRILRAPLRDEIDTPVDEQLIIEFYSRG
ncbi:MAG: 30S ribosomal protein S4 [Gaiellales bacterium]